MRKITRYILHYLGWPKDSAPTKGQQTVNEIKTVHLRRGYHNIGYHYLIDQNGIVYDGRPDAQEGAHCLGFNPGSIGINIMLKVGETPSDKAIKALVGLLRELKSAYGCPISSKTIYGHCDFLATACPGLLYPRIKEIIKFTNDNNFKTSVDSIDKDKNIETTKKKDTNEMINIPIFIRGKSNSIGNALLINSQSFIHAGLLAQYGITKVEWDGKQRRVILG